MKSCFLNAVAIFFVLTQLPYLKDVEARGGRVVEVAEPQRSRGVGKLKISLDQDGYMRQLRWGERVLLEHRAIELQKKVSIGQVSIYLVFSGDTAGFEYYGCNLVTVVSSEIAFISKGVPCQSTLSVREGVLFGSSQSMVSIAEKGDVEIWSYDYRTNVVSTVQAKKSDAYYREKYGRWSAKMIVDEAKRDGDFDAKEQLVCRRWECLTNYCRKFRLLKNPQKDRYYRIMEKSCAQ